MNNNKDESKENDNQINNINEKNNTKIEVESNIIINNNNKDINNENNDNNNINKSNNGNDKIRLDKNDNNKNKIAKNENITKDKNNENNNENKKDSKIENSEKKENEEETIDMGVEIPKKSRANFIKILKKDKNDKIQIPKKSYDYIFKVSLIGDASTGKTSIILRFIDNDFKEETSSTIGVDFKIVSLELEKNIFAKMQIWDTCGSERFKSITSSFIKSCSAFILVFDLSRANTFKSIDNWIKIIKENTTPNFLILIGNKSDLIEQRTIEKDIILEYCRKNVLNYMEISAKNNVNIEKMFKEVAYQLYMDIKKDQNNKIKTYENKGKFSNIQVQLDNKNEEKKCCS